MIVKQVQFSISIANAATRMERGRFIPLLLALSTALCGTAARCSEPANNSASTDFAVATHADRLVITRDASPVGEFVFADQKILRPHFQNLCAPDGTAVTRRHPPIAGLDAVDHADMHPGLWLGFGDISGEDFWRNKGTMRHDRFAVPPAAQKDMLHFTTESTLLARDGREMAQLRSQISIRTRPNAYLLVWDATFSPLMDGFYFGDQEEMGFGARVATALTEKNSGVIVSSTGEKTAKVTWGKAYAWCDYSGTVDGRHAGVTILPDPQNFRPSWWHNRDYGVFVANPFGRRALTHGKISRVEVKQGETLSLRFGVLLHSSTSGTKFDIEAAAEPFLKPAAKSSP